MIIGIGTDIAKADRFILDLSTPEWDTWTTKEEVNDNYHGEGDTVYDTLAKLFAIKEAFIKACGKGIFDIDMKQIIVSHKESGQPFIKAYPTDIIENCNTYVTVSDEKITDGRSETKLIIATVIIESKE